MERYSTLIRWAVVGFFACAAALSVFFGLKIKFSFDFEQLFPQGDPDLAFFREFVKEFETDDNFMLIALRRARGVFDSKFLNDVHDFTLSARDLPYVLESQSLTKLGYPLKTPFGVTMVPAIHRDDPSRFAEDKARILSDERFVHNFISSDGRTLTVLLKMKDFINLEESKNFLNALDKLLAGYNFEEYHYLGRPYFQRELVAMQQREVMVSAIVSGILVSILMWLLLRRFWGVVIALVSIALCLVLFAGFLGLSGRELSMLSALYPLLMIIVSTSDVVHITSKYIDELVKGRTRREAIRITLKEIGLATLMTSITTAIGFLSLVTSKIGPIREFGINSAIGVMLAFVTVVIFTSTVLSWFNADQISRLGKEQQSWNRWLNSIYLFSRFRPKVVMWGFAGVLLLSGIGISMVTTNYDIVNNLPRGKKITEDFLFFERELAGFRPVEYAVFAQNDYQADDLEVLQQIDTVEQYLKQFPVIQAVTSITAVYKSLNQMNANNARDAYRLPADEGKYLASKRLVSRMPESGVAVLKSRDGKKARISSRVKDCGADSLKAIYAKVDDFIARHTNSEIATFKRTGTGMILDKNSEYVRQSLLKGLGISILIISALMALVFRNFKMLLISLVPNLMPLLIAGGLLGFFSIELEAGIAIIFSVVFGIAVDDSIHFLSRFRLLRGQGIPVEEAIHATMIETGKPIIQTTILLFFGFLVLLFSISPPSVAIGLIISATLFSAVLCDVLLLPILLRRWM